jgi:hypothetical protein
MLREDSVADAVGSGRSLLRRAATPGQGPFQLDLQGEAEKRSHQDDQPEREGAVEGAVDGDRQHDVSDDQDLKAQQNRPAARMVERADERRPWEWRS